MPRKWTTFSCCEMQSGTAKQILRRRACGGEKERVIVGVRHRSPNPCAIFGMSDKTAPYLHPAPTRTIPCSPIIRSTQTREKPCAFPQTDIPPALRPIPFRAHIPLRHPLYPIPPPRPSPPSTTTLTKGVPHGYDVRTQLFRTPYGTSVQHPDRNLGAASIPLLNAYIAGNGKINQAGHFRVRILRTFLCSATTDTASIGLPDAISHFLQNHSAHHPPHIHSAQHILRPVVQYDTHEIHVYYPLYHPPVAPISGTLPTTLTRLNLLVVLFSLSPIEIARYAATH